MKTQIVAALNAAGIKTDGLDDAQLLSSYNSLVAKPHTDALTEANSKIAGFEANARAAEEAELTTLATELAVNSALKVDDLKKLGLPRLKELKGNASAAPILPAGGGTKAADEFAGYSINSLIDAK